MQGGEEDDERDYEGFGFEVGGRCTFPDAVPFRVGDGGGEGGVVVKGSSRGGGG